MAYTFVRHQNGPSSVIMAEHINELQAAIEDISQLNELNDHIADQENPHAVTKAQIGLGNVDNTSDIDKPVSTAMQAALDAKSDVTHDHDTAYAAKIHAHLIADVTGLQTALDGKSATGHTHDDRYYTETEMDTALAGKSNVGHGHAIADVTGLQMALDGKAATAHDHAIADVTDLQTALDSKAAANHDHDTVYAPLAHTSATNNPHGVTKAQVGLGNVPNIDATNRANHTGTQTASTISDFTTSVDARISAARGANNGIAPLDSSGRIPSQHMPPIAMTEVSVVSSQTAHLALTGQQEGDVVIRTDLNKTFIHNGGSSGTMSDWTEMVTPVDGITSVNGQAGPAVNLTTSDIAEGTRLYYTDARVAANSTVAANTAARHTHSNKTTLDAITEAFTTELKTKLDGIEAGADKTTTAKVDAAGAVMVADTSTTGMGFVVDEDNMVSNSATKLPTQQSVKAYVDAGLATKAASAHTHAIADVTGLQTALDGKAASSHTHSVSQISEFGEAVRDTITGALVAGSNVTIVNDDAADTITINAEMPAHTHDDRYYTESEVDTKLAGKANASHTHSTSSITTGVFDIARIPTGTTGTTVALGNHTHTATAVTDFAEAVRDTVGTALVAGSNVTIAVDDVADTITISSVVDPNHSHDDRYYTETETDTLLAGKSDVGHTHAIADVTGLQTALDGKAAASHAHSAADITSGTLNIARIPTGTTSSTVAKGDHTHSQYALTSHNHDGVYAPASHTHTSTNISDFGEAVRDTMGTALVAGSNVSIAVDDVNDAITISSSLPSHNHDERYYTETEVNTLLAGKAASSHTHAIADVTDLQTALDGKAASAHAHAASDITTGLLSISRIPTGTTSTTVALGNHTHSQYAPTSHTHDDRYYTESEVDSLLDGKANSSHAHAASDITSGTLALARIPTGTTSSTVALGNHNHDTVYAAIGHNHDGVYAPASHAHGVTDLSATGTRSSSTYLRGDGTWSTPPNTTYSVMSQTEAETGTATTSRVISAVRLKETIEYHAPVKATDLATKADTGHTHDDRYYTETEVNTLLAGKAESSHSHTSSSITDFSEAVRDTMGTALVGGTNVSIVVDDVNDTITINSTVDPNHTHDDRYYTESEVNSLLADKAASSHTHDDRYYTETEVNNLLAGKAASTHYHDGSHITSGTVNFYRLPVGTASTQVAVGNHTHSGYASTSHGHSFSSLFPNNKTVYGVYNVRLGPSTNHYVHGSFQGSCHDTGLRASGSGFTWAFCWFPNLFFGWVITDAFNP